MNSEVYDWFGYNKQLFQAINKIKDPFLDVFMQLGTVLGNPAFWSCYAGVLGLLVLYRVYHHGQRQEWSDVVLWLAAPVALIAGTFVVDLVLTYLGQRFPHAGPLSILGKKAVRVLGELTSSGQRFPSSYAAFSVVLVAAVWTLMEGVQRQAGVLFVIWVGVSRIYVGANFPADVVAGWLSATVTMYIVWKLSFLMVRPLVHWWAGWLARRARLR